MEASELTDVTYRSSIMHSYNVDPNNPQWPSRNPFKDSGKNRGNNPPAKGN
ncbi:hypothetical protein RR42_s3368 [Cupriavidus basilensis]|uniref:Uncharacterized protein n=1 Tax=Cupriavidus basilensis TaxID=68895 RepID=A0A0C4YSN0_9BURK|nr:hypothetical protein RR42_s3368 [Cupriavidus basilensis]